MSERDPPLDPDRDPIDRAYAQAEARLDDEAARVARRARLLAGIDADFAAAPTRTPSPRPRPGGYRTGGWLVAASVAGLAVILAVRIYQPPPTRALVATTPVPAARDPGLTTPAPGVPAPPPAKSLPGPGYGLRPAPPPPVALVATPPPPFLATPEPADPPPADPPASAPPPPAPVRDAEGVIADDTAATRGFTLFSGDAARSGPIFAPTVRARAPVGAPPDPEVAVARARGERLRAAAAAGRLGEITALIDQGAPVDAPDAGGRTALMLSLRANQPAAAVLLRKRGADLDRRDKAGVSARKLVIAKDDPALARALGVSP